MLGKKSKKKETHHPGIQIDWVNEKDTRVSAGDQVMPDILPFVNRRRKEGRKVSEDLCECQVEVS